MREIRLTQGKVAIVDDEDYDLVSRFRWHFDGRYAAHKSGKKVYMHRLLVGDTGMDVDHINRDKLDNRRLNLRVCTRSQNLLNKGAQGIYRSKRHNKWEVRVANRYFGVFEDKQEALRVRRAEVLRLGGIVE